MTLAYGWVTKTQKRISDALVGGQLTKWEMNFIRSATDVASPDSHGKISIPPFYTESTAPESQRSGGRGLQTRC